MSAAARYLKDPISAITHFAALVAAALAVVLLRCISREDLLLMPKGKKIADLLRLP